jgi:hypothetical protein
MIFKEKDLGDISDKVYGLHRCKINNTNKLEDRYKFIYNSKEYIIRILKFDIFILILDEIKDYFKIPHSEKAKAVIEKDGIKIPVIISLYKNEIGINIFNNTEDEGLSIKNLYNCPSFVSEIRRLFAFRFIMCLNSNNESRIEVITKKLNSKFVLDAGLSREVYTPICIRESSYFNSKTFSHKILKADSTDIPDTVIEKWFDKSHELVYETIQNLTTGIDFIKFKIMLVDIIQKHIKEVRDEYHKDKSVDNFKKMRSVESLIWWSNAVSERIRQF